MTEYTVRVAKSCEEAVAALTAALERRGLRVTRSFDLHTALAGHDPCPCPHHGTEHCTCNYTILLVYCPIGAGSALFVPWVVTAHQRDQATWLYLLRPEWAASQDGMPNSPVWKQVVMDSMVEAVFSDEPLELEERTIS